MPNTTAKVAQVAQVEPRALRSIHSPPHDLAKTAIESVFSAAEIERLLAVGFEQSFPADELLIRRGAPGEAMYILVSGMVEIDLVFREPIVLNRRGDYFGELSFIHPSHRRSANIRTLEPSTFRVLNRDSFDELQGDDPHILIKLFRRTCAYIIDSEERLINDLLRKNDELSRSFDYLRRTREALSAQEILAKTDALTQLYNRRCLTEQLASAIGRRRRWGQSTALILIDLDCFKQINDRFGHSAGDKALCAVADVLRDHIRDNDLACRLGGDEFAILMHDADAIRLPERLESLRAGIESSPPVRSGAPGLTASLGGTLCRETDSAQDALERADRCMYEAKTSGGNRVVVSD